MIDARNKDMVSRDRAAWGRASMIAALLWNVNIGKGGHQRTADDFNPYARMDAAKRPASKRIDLAGLAALMTRT